MLNHPEESQQKSDDETSKDNVWGRASHRPIHYWFCTELAVSFMDA